MMVETYDEFDDAKADGFKVGCVLTGGKPVYFRYETDDEAADFAFEIMHGRPPGEEERIARAVVDSLRPGWLEASLADLVGNLT